MDKDVVIQHPVSRVLWCKPALLVAIAALFVCVFSIAPNRALADELKGFQPGPGTVSKKDMGGSNARHKGREGYLERWMLRVNRSDGGWMQLSFILTNLGPGDHRAVVDIMRLGHGFGKPDTKRVFSRRSKKHLKPNWTVSSKDLNIQMGPSFLRKKGRGLEGSMKSWDHQVRFTVSDHNVAWKPGNGMVSFPDGGEYRTQILKTHAQFKGEERRLDGPWHAFQGTVTVEHAVTNLMFYLLANRMLRAQGKAGPYTIHFQEIYTPEIWNEERFGWLVVTQGSKVVASSLRASAKPTRFRQVKTKTGSRHRVPVQYVVSAPTDAGSIKLTVKTRSSVHVEDLLSALPKSAQLVLRALIQPANMYDRARLQLTLPGEKRTRKGKGLSVYSAVYER